MRQILNVPIRDYFGNNLKGNFIADTVSNSIVFTTLVNSSFSTSRVRRVEYIYQDEDFIRRQYFADSGINAEYSISSDVAALAILSPHRCNLLRRQ